MNILHLIDFNDDHVTNASNQEGVTEDHEMQAERYDPSTIVQRIIPVATSNNPDDCEVKRGKKSDDNELKHRLMGFLVSFWSCGIAVGLTESIVSEGPRTVTDHFLSMKTYGASLPSASVMLAI
jgi:hypothetical protein